MGFGLEQSPCLTFLKMELQVKVGFIIREFILASLPLTVYTKNPPHIFTVTIRLWREIKIHMATSKIL